MDLCATLMSNNGMPSRLQVLVDASQPIGDGSTYVGATLTSPPPWRPTAWRWTWISQ